MAKATTRESFRVTVTGALDLTLPIGPQIELRVKDAIVWPQRLGDLGWASISDSMASTDIPGDYERRCQEIVQMLRRQHPNVEATVVCDSTETCSYCGGLWEVATEEDAAAYPDDPHWAVGVPACCDNAQAEYFAAQAAELVAE